MYSFTVVTEWFNVWRMVAYGESQPPYPTQEECLGMEWLDYAREPVTSVTESPDDLPPIEIDYGVISADLAEKYRLYPDSIISPYVPANDSDYYRGFTEVHFTFKWLNQGSRWILSPFVVEVRSLLVDFRQPGVVVTFSLASTLGALLILSLLLGGAAGGAMVLSRLRRGLTS